VHRGRKYPSAGVRGWIVNRHWTGTPDRHPKDFHAETQFKERRPAILTLRGWAIAVQQESGAIRECEEHGWMKDRTDPDARERPLDIARRDPPAGLSSEDAIAELRNMLDSIGDTCRNARTSSRTPGIVHSAPRREERTAEAFLHALARVADLLDGLLHRRRRSPGLLRLIPHFVLLAAPPLCPDPVCVRVPSSSLPPSAPPARRK
jgi:hypothetical protein